MGELGEGMILKGLKEKNEEMTIPLNPSCNPLKDPMAWTWLIIPTIFAVFILWFKHLLQAMERVMEKCKTPQWWRVDNGERL